jgi:hypothetical protein
MDAFTMIVLACVAGEPKCLTSRVNEPGFTSAAACEARIDDVTRDMTKVLAQRPDLKGRQVTYDVSCMSREQLQAKLGVTEASI